MTWEELKVYIVFMVGITLLLGLVHWLCNVMPSGDWRAFRRDQQFWFNANNSPYARKLFGEDK